MRSSPLCGVSVLHPAQYDLLDNNHGDRQKTKHKGYPGCLAHEVICHVLRRLCQPTPTPIYIYYFTTPVPTEASYYMYQYILGGGVLLISVLP